MKKIVRRFPFVSRIVLALVLGVISIVVSGLLYNILPIKPWFPFVGEVLLVLSTVWLYQKEKQDLRPLGFRPTLKRTGYLFLGFVAAAFALLMATWLRTLYTGELWHTSPVVDGTSMLKTAYYMLPTVAVQELMFRGYLFTKTISRLGVVKANVIFTLLFAAVHVLDRDVMQNPAKMLMLAVCTSVGHLWFATALLRSKTLFFPVGLHWGNNWAVVHLVGTADSPHSFFYLTNQKFFTTWPPFLILLGIFNLFFLLVVWLTWKAKWPGTKKALQPA